MSSVLKNLGQLHIVAGKVDGTGTAALTSNDGSATMVDNGTGDYTVTFGEAFLAVPAVAVSHIDATLATTNANGVQIKAVSTASVQFNAWNMTISGTDATDHANAAFDLDFHFIAVGMRNN